MFKVKNKDIRTTPLESFCCFYCKLWTYFTPCSSPSIVNLELANAGWVKIVFWNISQNSQENSSNGVFFLTKNDSIVGVFLWISWYFSEQLIHRIFLDNCFYNLSCIWGTWAVAAINRMAFGRRIFWQCESFKTYLFISFKDLCCLLQYK